MHIVYGWMDGWMGSDDLTREMALLSLGRTQGLGAVPALLASLEEHRLLGVETF